jgi:hypothetical protein
LVIIKTDPHEGKVHRFDHASQLVVVHQSFKENTAKERERKKKGILMNQQQAPPNALGSVCLLLPSGPFSTCPAGNCAWNLDNDFI